MKTLDEQIEWVKKVLIGIQAELAEEPRDADSRYVRVGAISGVYLSSILASLEELREFRIESARGNLVSHYYRESE